MEIAKVILIQILDNDKAVVAFLEHVMLRGLMPISLDMTPDQKNLNGLFDLTDEEIINEFYTLHFPNQN